MGVLLPEELLVGTGDEQLLPTAVVRARRSATVGTDRPWLVGVDDLKPLPPWLIGEIGLFFRTSALGDFVRGSLAGEDAKNR